MNKEHTKLLVYLRTTGGLFRCPLYPLYQSQLLFVQEKLLTPNFFIKRFNVIVQTLCIKKFAFMPDHSVLANSKN